MKELPQGSGAHAAKHTRKVLTLEVDGSEAMIAFSPAVLGAMQNLHARVVTHGDEKFDDDAAHILKKMADGKPMSVEQTLSCLVTVCAEAGQCYAKTGDRGVYEALHGVEAALNAMDGNALPTTVTISRRQAKGPSS